MRATDHTLPKERDLDSWLLMCIIANLTKNFQMEPIRTELLFGGVQLIGDDVIQT